MSDLKVISLKMVNVYLINSCILVDTGTKGSEDKILAKFEEFNIKPEDIKLIVLTHGHDDHIGSVGALAKKTSAKVLIHEIEYKQIIGEIEDEIKPVSAMMKLFYLIIKKFKKEPVINTEFKADIIINSDFDLSTFGVDGKVVLTPGHSKGSISILLDSDKAVIGDNLMAFLPRSKPKRPFLAYDLELVKKSMKKLIDDGAQKFFLSHGESYDLEIIEESINSF